MAVVNGFGAEARPGGCAPRGLACFAEIAELNAASSGKTMKKWSSSGTTLTLSSRRFW